MDNLSRTVEEARQLPPPKTIWSFELDNYVRDETNLFAHAAMIRAIEKPGEHNPIVLVGEIGVGKTHLLQGARRAWMRKYQTLRRVHYLTAEGLVNFYIEAAMDKDPRKEKMGKLRRWLRGTGCLILDELSFLEGKKGTQGELLETLKVLLEKGAQVICASNIHPSKLNVREELQSRLQGGLVVNVDKPKQETRRSILDRLIDRQHQPKLIWPEEVREFLAKNLNGDVRSLIGAFNSVEAHGRLLGETIGTDLVKKVLRISPGEEPGMILSAEAIERAVEVCSGLLPDHGLLRTNARNVSKHRRLAMYLTSALLYKTLSPSEVANHFGLELPDHDSAIRYIKRKRKSGDRSLERQIQAVCQHLRVKSV